MRESHSLQLWAGHDAALAHNQTHSQRLFSSAAYFFISSLFFLSLLLSISFLRTYFAENVAFCCDIFLQASSNKTHRLISMLALNSL